LRDLKVLKLLRSANKCACKLAERVLLLLSIKSRNVKLSALSNVKCSKRSKNKWPAKSKTNVKLKSKQPKRSVQEI